MSPCFPANFHNCRPFFTGLHLWHTPQLLNRNAFQTASFPINSNHLSDPRASLQIDQRDLLFWPNWNGTRMLTKTIRQWQLAVIHTSPLGTRGLVVCPPIVMCYEQTNLPDYAALLDCGQYAQQINSGPFSHRRNSEYFSDSSLMPYFHCDCRQFNPPLEGTKQSQTNFTLPLDTLLNALRTTRHFPTSTWGCFLSPCPQAIVHHYSRHCSALLYTSKRILLISFLQKPP